MPARHCYALRSGTRRRKGLGGGLVAAFAKGDGEEMLADGAACALGLGLETIKLGRGERFAQIHSNDYRRGSGLFAWFFCSGGAHKVGRVARFVQSL